MRDKGEHHSLTVLRLGIRTARRLPWVVDLSFRIINESPMVAIFLGPVCVCHGIFSKVLHTVI